MQNKFGSFRLIFFSACTMTHVYSELEKVIEESSNVTIKLDNIRICKYEIDI